MSAEGILWEAFQRAAEETAKYGTPADYIAAHYKEFEGRKFHKYPVSVLVWLDNPVGHYTVDFRIVEVRESWDNGGKIMYNYSDVWPFPGKAWAFCR